VNKKRFIGLIIMMLFSTAGIILVQIIWIRNAVRVANENFDYFVNASIRNAASDIESSRKMNFFNDFMFPQAGPNNDTTIDISSYVSMGTFSTGNGNNFSIRITNQSVRQEAGKEPQIVVHDTIITPDSAAFIVQSPNEPGKMVIIKGAGTTGKGPNGIYVRQNEYLEWIKKRRDEFSNMSDQMISEVYQWEKTMDIGSREIRSALQRSFAYSGIQTPFEFAIIRNGVLAEDQQTKTGKDDFLKSKYMVRLFPDNIIRQDLVVSVVFPERTNYVLGTMPWILSGSLLFSLIILATFALSLWFIIRQKKISEIKSDFINNMTHEFKTPIATISLAADTITNPKVIKDEDGIRHFIGMIKKENSRMNKKVETILQIASLDKNEIIFKFENISLHTVIEHAVETVEIQVQQRNGKISLMPDAHEPVIYGDYEHLVNLVNNLLDNAIKYSTGAPEITVQTKNYDAGVIVSVEDRGIGMSKSVQSKIFERFYRQNSGNVHDVKGFGLGLNYARAIVEAHRGRIDVYSEPGKGSRFDISLPFNWENER
jgi:two-component system phosphate regulon sensor histidine kinase PhoR